MYNTRTLLIFFFLSASSHGLSNYALDNYPKQPACKTLFCSLKQATKKDRWLVQYLGVPEFIQYKLGLRTDQNEIDYAYKTHMLYEDYEKYCKHNQSMLRVIMSLFKPIRQSTECKAVMAASKKLFLDHNLL